MSKGQVRRGGQVRGASIRPDRVTYCGKGGRRAVMAAVTSQGAGEGIPAPGPLSSQ